jgi:DNA-binding CsgD family transcriptional regulator
MRKPNRWHLTAAERGRIRRLTLQRVPQSTIGRILGIGRSTVSKWQARMGLPTRVPIPEKKILQLFAKGWGGYKIAKRLHIAVSAVYKVAHKNNFHREDNAGYPTPPENEKRLIEALQRRENYAKRLAKKYGVGLVKANRLAHEVLACPEFRPGLSKPVLSSNFPQKHFDVKLARPDEYVELVQRVLDKCFDGKLPPLDDARFVVAMMAAFAQTTLEKQPQPVLDSFATGLAQAIVAIRGERNATRIH